MSLKLNVGASRKITDDHFGSRGASVNPEIELDASLAGDSAKLQERIRHLFNLVRQSFAEELNGANGQHPPPRNASRQAAAPSPSANGAKSANGQSNGTGRLATPRQIKALYAITKQQGTATPSAWRASSTALDIKFAPLNPFTMSYTNRPSGIQQAISFDGHR